jgi:hypothetical protein
VQILALTLQQVLRRTDVSTTEDLSLGFPLPGLMDVRTADPSGSAATIESRATNRIDDAETPES